MNQKIKRYLAGGLALISLLLCAASCKKKQPENPDNKVTPIQIVDTATKTSTYRLVRPQKASKEIITITGALSKAITAATGATLEVEDDFYREASEISEYEVLIGSTNRTESIETEKTLLYDDFIIGVCGKKLVLLGGSDAATVEAVQYFIDNLLNESMTYSQKNIAFYKAVYPYTALNVGETDISEFKIVYGSTDDKLSAEYLQELIIGLCGKKLDVVSSTLGKTEHEFLIGDCNREGSLKETDLNTGIDYLARLTNGKIALTGRDALSKYFAAEKIAKTMFSGEVGGQANLSLQEISGTKAQENTLRIVTNNICSYGTFSPRAEKLVEIYRTLQPDIICLQECYGWKAEDDSTGYSNVVDALSDTYACVNKTTSFNTPILYRKDKFTVVKDEKVFYNDKAVTSETSSKNKSFEITVFKEKATDKQFAVVSSHFALFMPKYAQENSAYATYKDSVEGAAWREKNAEQLLTKLKSSLSRYADIPVLIAGDFNGTKKEAFYKSITESYSDSSLVAKAYASPTTSATWHNIGEAPKAGNPIDFIFTNKNTEVLSYQMYKTQTALDATDHIPLVVDFRLK